MSNIKTRKSKSKKGSFSKFFLLEGESEKNLLSRSFNINFVKNNRCVLKSDKQIDFKKESKTEIKKSVFRVVNSYFKYNLESSIKIFIWIDLDTYITENKIKDSTNFILNCNSINDENDSNIQIILNYSKLENSIVMLRDYNKPYINNPVLTNETRINENESNFNFERICKFLS